MPEAPAEASVQKPAKKTDVSRERSKNGVRKQANLTKIQQWLESRRQES